LTVGVLLKWWIDTYVAGRTSERQERDRFRLYFETSELARLPVARLDAGRIETFLQSFSGQLGPESTNKLRAMIRTAWNRGRKAGILHGENPTRDVDRRKVPKRAPAFHEAHEVPGCSRSSRLWTGTSRPPRSTRACARASSSAWRSATSI
jgi:hypothetical protein